MYACIILPSLGNIPSSEQPVPPENYITNLSLQTDVNKLIYSVNFNCGNDINYLTEVIS